jgi:predicted ATPase with chaperone activity
MSIPLREVVSTNSATMPGSALATIPPEPTSIAETGLSMGFLTDLVLKTIYFSGQINGAKLAEATCLPFLNVLDRVLEFLKLEEYVDIIGAKGGFSERSFEYVIATKGRIKVHEVLDRSQYAGPAPVPLNEYIAMVQRQSVGNLVIEKRMIQEALNHLVIAERLLDKIGPAANSARSLFLYGPAGNGKTVIAEALAGMLGGLVLIPHAVEVDGQVIKIFDPLNHDVAATTAYVEPEPTSPFGVSSAPVALPDRRWLVCKRPHVTTGGELLLEQLELIFDPIAKVYEAPYQLKANGGLFLIDDFGRQQCRPQDLLNRWIVPLEKKIDFLALQNGKKLAMPFDVLIVFSTNLSPKDLVDEAFLRRIRHKIEVGDPSPQEYRTIFQRVCKAKQIPYNDEGLRYLIQEHYIKAGRPLRAVHPRDLSDQIIDEAKYRGVPPAMTRELIDRACEAYFVKLG